MADQNHLYDPHEHEPLPEGVEAPPPYTRTMGIVRWCLLIALSVFALTMVLSHFGLSPWEAQGAETVQYHCPMHPTYISNQPGECPICGMTLVPIGKGEAKAAVDSTKPAPKPPTPAPAKAETTYTCSMDPDVISDKPGVCPKCGMDLIPVVKKVEAAKTVYTCPMHPEVVSDKPGKCPKCGMKLEQVKDSTTTPSHGESNMPGMDMSAKTPHGKPAQTTEEKSPPIDTFSPGDMGQAPVAGLVPVTIEPSRLQLIGVRTGHVQRRVPGGTIDVVGMVTPDEGRVKNLHVRVNGWVQDLFVDQTGQLVEKGKPLLSIYSQDLYQAEQDFISARDAALQPSPDTTLALMRSQLLDAARERLHLLGLSDSDLKEMATSSLPSQQIVLRSPFSGYVLEKNVTAGQYVGPDQNLLTIADLSTIWVIGDIYEQDLADIKVGQKAVLHLPSFPGEVFDGTIDFIYPMMSEQTRTLKIRLIIRNPQLRLRPGMYAEVQLQHRAIETLVVPSDAILDGGDIQYAFVVHNGIHFEPRKVTIGRSFDDWTEVISGIREGEEVVTSANFLIDSESRLKAAVSGLGSAAPAPSSESHTH